MFLPAKVYYCVRPDFFHHNHWHRTKLDALKEAGIDARMIAFVTRDDVAAYKSYYEKADQDYHTSIKVLPDRIGYSKCSNWFIRFFFFLRLLTRKQVIVHSHLFDFSPLYLFRKIPFIKNRLKVFVEYEGDIPSETLYRETVDSKVGPQEIPPQELKEIYDAQIKQQAREISNADVVMVVSTAHLELLEARHKQPIRHIIFPTTFDASYRFCKSDRKRIRSKHHVGESDLILIHLGGAVNSWHRFRETCKLVSELATSIAGLKFFAIVRSEDHPYANSVIAANRIDHLTELCFVDPSDVSAYLSACDIGLILRHNHPMTRIVSTGKLGQYLACGLSVLTTGAHAVYNDFMEVNKLNIDIKENLKVTESLKNDIIRNRDIAHNEKIRYLRSDMAAEEFCNKNDQFRQYVRATAELIH